MFSAVRNNWRQNYRKAVTFSYDDGNQQDIRLLQLLNQYGLKATFHVNTGLDYHHGTWRYDDRLEVHRLNLHECPEVYDGHEIAVHGRTHQNLTLLSPEELHAELADDMAAIEQIYGVRPVGMSYPYGIYNDNVIQELVRLGIRYGRTVQSTHAFKEQKQLLCFHPTCHHDDPALFHLAEQFLQAEPEEPQIFYIWGHSYEFDGKNNWEHMQRFLEYISGKNDVFYGTNAEVLLG